MQYKKNLLNSLLLGYGGLMLVLIGMLTGSMVIGSNVLYMDSPWLQVLEIAITFVDIIAYAVSAAVIIYGIYIFGAKKLTTIYAAYLCITVFHYVAILCIGWLVFPGTLPKTIQELTISFLENIVLFVVLDCLRIFIIAFIAGKLLKKNEDVRLDYNRKARILDQTPLEARSIAFPFKSLISFKNPIQVGVFATALIYWLTYLLQYIYIDILTLIKVDYVEGFGLQIIYMLLNAVFACACYCLMLYIMMKFDEKMPKSDN